jgi:hypothetical protein
VKFGAAVFLSFALMKRRTLLGVFLALSLSLNSGVSLAFETDQYNLPPQPLADIGIEVTEHIVESLNRAVEKVNRDISTAKACIAGKKVKDRTCGSAEAERKKLTYLLSNDSVADELYMLLGDGSIFVTKFGKWMGSHKFRGQPSSYKVAYKESIYVAKPSNYLTLSPTVRLYGVEFGIDKLEHLFQQGYKYNQIRTDSIKAGQTPDQAISKAIAWGQTSERTYYGTLVSGVFSNGDLYANYAGMKFYQGLTSGMEINGVLRPPMVVLDDDKWETIRKSALTEMLLEPFITEHLNEALNPSGYTINLIPSIKRTLKKNSCPEWHRLYPMISKAAIKSRMESLERWYDQDYGFTQKKRMIDLAEMCFSDPSASAPKL